MKTYTREETLDACKQYIKGLNVDIKETDGRFILIVSDGIVSGEYPVNTNLLFATDIRERCEAAVKIYATRKYCIRP